MTLEEIKKKLFPSVYKTRSGELVEITGFAFIGKFITDDGKSQSQEYIWDEKMNFVRVNRRYQGDDRGADLVDMIKGPAIDPDWQGRKEKKNGA